jgi:hypothetical protein
LALRSALNCSSTLRATLLKLGEVGAISTLDRGDPASADRPDRLFESLLSWFWFLDPEELPPEELPDDDLPPDDEPPPD